MTYAHLRMEQHGYPAMNSEKTIFMKREGADVTSYIQEVLAYIKKALRPKKLPMSPGLVLNNEDCPI